MPSYMRCPKCGSEMVVRTAKKGANSGQRFYVCINYPECKGKVPVTKQSSQPWKPINELENELGWSHKKLKAYIHKIEGYDLNIVNEVYNIMELHNDVINEAFIWAIQKQRGPLVRAFLQHLEKEWSKEYSEILIEKVARATMKRTVKSIDMAYIVGYMLGKGWISMEHLVEFNLGLGDNLAHNVRSVWKRAKSRGTAYATAFGAVSVIGNLEAWGTSDVILNACDRKPEPSKHEVIEEILKRQRQSKKWTDWSQKKTR